LKSTWFSGTSLAISIGGTIGSFTISPATIGSYYVYTTGATSSTASAFGITFTLSTGAFISTAPTFYGSAYSSVDDDGV